jgi:Domain of unknown function (DUF5911)
MLLEDYGLIGDMQSAALVGRDGAVDWLCLPRFDSASCFSALLGDERHGRWLVAPAGEVRAISRRYLRGRVSMQMELVLRPDYGSIRPWVERATDGVLATAGPDAFRLTLIFAARAISAAERSA